LPLVPAVVARTQLPGALNDGTKAPVSACQQCLQLGTLVGVPRECEAAPANRLVQQLLPPLDRGLVGEWFPLKRCLWFWNEGTHADVDFSARSNNAVAQRPHLAHHVANGHHVFIGLPGQADHEVELDRAPAAFEHLFCDGEEVLRRDVLVDAAPQGVSSGLGCKGESRAMTTGQGVGELNGEGIQAEARQRHRCVALLQQGEELRDNLPDLCVVR